MKKVYILGLSFVVAGLLVGCGSSDSDGGGGSSISGSQKVITSVPEAKQAAAAMTQVNALSNIGSGFAPTSSTAPSRAASLASIPTQTMNCASGGTQTIGGNYSDNGSSYDMKTSYNNCNQYGTTMDGSMELDYETSGSNINMEIEMNNFHMTQSTGSYMMDFKMEMSTNTSYDPMLMEIDGTISLDASGYNYNVGYDHFKVQTSGQYLNLNGTVSMESNMYSCWNGTYTIETVSGLYVSGSGYSSGTMIVNGATYTYSGSSVQITLPDGSTETVNQSDLVNSCN